MASAPRRKTTASAPAKPRARGADDEQHLRVRVWRRRYPELYEALNGIEDDPLGKRRGDRYCELADLGLRAERERLGRQAVDAEATAGLERAIREGFTKLAEALRALPARAPSGPVAESPPAITQGPGEGPEHDPLFGELVSRVFS